MPASRIALTTASRASDSTDRSSCLSKGVSPTPMISTSRSVMNFSLLFGSDIKRAGHGRAAGVPAQGGGAERDRRADRRPFRPLSKMREHAQPFRQIDIADE